MLFQYRAYGLALHSEIPLPLPLSNNDSCDVSIMFGSVPKALKNSIVSGFQYQLGPSEFLFWVDGVGRFKITEGKSIIVETLADRAGEEDLAVYILGSCLAAIMEQRGMLCLHASSVSWNDEAVLFAGRSGIGKSTIAAALIKSGYQLRSDDVVPLEIRGGEILARKGLPFSKLWPDSLQKLDLNSDGLPKIRPCIEKRRISWTPELSDSEKPLPIKEIFLLTTIQSSAIEVSKLNPFEAFASCKANVYRPQFLRDPSRQKGLFETLTLLVKKTRVTRISRPKTTFKLSELVEAVGSLIETRE